MASAAGAGRAHEEAERVAHRVEQHPDVFLGLEVGQGGARGAGVRDGPRQVVHLDARWIIICCLSGVDGHCGRTKCGSVWNDRPAPPSGGASITQSGWSSRTGQSSKTR